jgi:hypothetical protein
MNDSTDGTREIRIRIPRGDKLPLSARARFVWARLVRLPFPATAAKLVGWCGGLLGRSDGLAAALKDLEKLNLAEHGPRGWVALPPSGDVAEQFEWPKKLANLSRWQDKYGYTPVTVPVSYPFAKLKVATTVKGKMRPLVTRQNALEVWLVWECLASKTRDDMPGQRLLEHRLGITRGTARKIVRDLTAIPGVFDDEGQFRVFGGERQSHAVCTDPVDKVLAEVGVAVESRQGLRDKADELKLTNTKLIRLVRKAVAKHNAEEYGDDPTAMIVSYLKKEASFKAGGRGTSLKNLRRNDQ